MSTIPWGLSELWGGGVLTSYIDHSGPRIRRLLLRSIINPPCPPLLSSYVPSHPSSSTALPPHRIIRPPRRHPSPSQHTDKLCTLPPLTGHHHSPTLPPLPCPRHAFQIPVTAAPTLLQGSLLAWLSASVPWMSDAITARESSPRPQTPSLSHKPWILVAGPPTPLPPPDSSRYIPEEALDLVQPKISPMLPLSGIYLKSFIYNRNRTNSQ